MIQSMIRNVRRLRFGARGPDVLVTATEPGIPRHRGDAGELVAYFAQLEHDGARFEPAPYQVELLKAALDGKLPTMSETFIAQRRFAKRERLAEAIAWALLKGDRIAVAGRGPEAEALILRGAERARLYAAALDLDLPADLSDLLTMTPGNRKDHIA